MFERFFSIDRDERHSVVLMFMYGFGTAAAYVLARTIADSAFLSHIDLEHLPALYMVSAGVVALSSLIYGHLVRHHGLRKLILLTLLLLAASSTVMPLAMERFADSLTVFAIVYVVAQVRGSLGTIQFATLLNEQFGHDQPERVVGLVGAGATLAGITMGTAIGLVADYVNVESLMYLAAVIDVVTMLPVLSLKRVSVNPMDSSHSLSVEAGLIQRGFRLRDALRSKYVVSIAGVVTVSVLAATMVEYQWKVTAANELQRDEETLARYFGFFYGTVYLITGLLQLFATGRLLQKRGVLFGLLAFPGALLAATFTTWVVSAERLLLWPMTLSKACDTLRRGLHDPSIQVAYSPLANDLRRQAIMFIAGMAKPFAEAAAAVALVAMTPWISPRQLAVVIMVLICCWLALDIRLWWQFRTLRKL